VGLSKACNDNAVQNCIQSLVTRAKQVENFASEKQLDELCNAVGEVESCLRNSGCLNVTTFRNMWNGMRDGINYLCVEERQVFLRHSKCIQSSATSQMAQQCSEIYARTISTGGSVCSATNTLMSCVYDTVIKSCPVEAVKVLITYTYKILEPILTPTNCTLSLEFLTNGAASYKEIKALLLLGVVLIAFVNGKGIY